MKRGVMLNLTDEYIRYLRSRGINISSMVDKQLGRRVRALRKANSAHLGRGKSS